VDCQPRKFTGGDLMPVLPYKSFSPELGEEVFIASGAFVIGRVAIGNRTSIWFGAVVRGDMESIRIGAESNIQDNVTVHVDYDFPTVVGDRVTVGHNAILHGCTVEDGCLIGMGSILLNGSVIGRDSLIAAGSLITQGIIIPPRSLVIGSPGKVVRTLSEEQIPVKGAMYRNYMAMASDYRL
jgi:gamma-carbonic anhydrase